MVQKASPCSKRVDPFAVAFWDIGFLHYGRRRSTHLWWQMEIPDFASVKFKGLQTRVIWRVFHLEVQDLNFTIKNIISIVSQSSCTKRSCQKYSQGKSIQIRISIFSRKTNLSKFSCGDQYLMHTTKMHNLDATFICNYLENEKY